MGIKNRNIDLTTNNRFGRKADEYNYDASNKLFKRRWKDRSDIRILIDNIDKFPWRKKAHEVKNNLIKRVRSYNDPLSDEFGHTIRSTSKNTFIVFDKSKNYNSLFLDMFFIDCRGYIPYRTSTVCERCGKVSHIGNNYRWKTICPDCWLSLRRRFFGE